MCNVSCTSKTWMRVSRVLRIKKYKHFFSTCCQSGWLLALQLGYIGKKIATRYICQIMKRFEIHT